MYLKSLTKEKFIKTFPYIVAAGLIQLLTYYLPAFLPEGREIYIKLGVDDRIPFLNWFIFFYVIAYPQWALQWLLLAAEGEPLRTKYFRAEILGKVIGMIIFIVYPVTMTRPADTGTGLFGWMTAAIYAIDRPIRLFPSMHCFLAWIWFRAVLEAEDMSAGVKWFTGVMCVLICASTLFVKQHLFLDVPAGILLCELCIFISDRWPFRRSERAVHAYLEAHWPPQKKENGDRGAAS